MICLLLPWPVSVNSAYRNLGGRGRVKTKAYKQWMERADAWLVEQRSSSLTLPAEPLSGFLRMEIRGHPPNKRKRDYSNIIKVVEDLLTSYKVYEDDSQIKDIRCLEDLESVSQGAVLVTVEEL